MRSLARGHTELCIKVLAGIVSQEAVPAAARVSAAGILLDRGWGKAPTTHAAPEAEPIVITIRDLVRERRDQVLDLPAQPARVIGNGGGDEP